MSLQPCMAHQYEVIRNIRFFNRWINTIVKEEFIIYQGSVNEGRCFETLIPAMRWIKLPLDDMWRWQFYGSAHRLIQQYDVADKVLLKGLVTPNELEIAYAKSEIGLSLFENGGRSVYLSLANRFFDYIHAGTPQLCVDYPAYRRDKQFI